MPRYGTSDSGTGLISLSARIEQEYITRADDDGFADGDVMGVYIVDYDAGNPGELKDKGNRADNVHHTFDEKGRRWNPAYDIYWKDAHTMIDLYGYYPAGSPESVNACRFSVKTDQNRLTEGGMGGYEASDFLWGKVEGVSPTSNAIPLPMSHKMASARVVLAEGSGFAAGEWAELKKQVLVSSTARECEIDLSTGTVISVGDPDGTSIIPLATDEGWRAIIVPQTVAATSTLFSITVDGFPYRFSKNEDFTYSSGHMCNFTIRVDKKISDGKYELTLESESITPWENDPVSHDGYAREYVVVQSSAGGLREAVTQNGLDPAKIKNLKITGELNATDFYWMRDAMQMLQALNLKEVRIKGYGQEPNFGTPCIDDQIPPSAFYNVAQDAGMSTLTRVVLPDRLKSIGAHAFYDCHNLTGSLTIPEGVIDIQTGAFYGCRSLTGSLSLPSTLRYLGNGAMSADGKVDETYAEGNDHYNGVFSHCGFTCELMLPDGLELIRGYAFEQCSNLYGQLHLPQRLRRIGQRAFTGCGNLKGTLEIPQGVNDIPFETFVNCGFDGSLILHDGIMSIGESAFAGTAFRGELRLPKGLVVINDNVFSGCDFSGELKFPKGLAIIGALAFANNTRLTGTVEFPEGLQTIGAGAFANCRGLEGLVFPESLENISCDPAYGDNAGAFAHCYGINSIICRSSEPPYMVAEVFEGIAKDNFTVEVPESSVTAYGTAPGWCEFRRIAAHHELVCRPSVSCALGSGNTRTLTITSEGEWEVLSKPEWCRLSAMSGSYRDEINLTVSAMSGGESREGDVVFILKDKGYTASCHVTQYGYAYAEDEVLTLQKATRGSRGGINVVIIGDGFDALEIASGNYLEIVREAAEHFFAIEPFASYRNYFNVYTSFPVSTDSGIGGLNSIRHSRFGTTYTGTGNGVKCDEEEIFNYALGMPGVDNSNLDETVIIVIPNTTDYGGACLMWETGASIAFCPKNGDAYPYDFRGLIQHEAGGHAFGKLGDERILHNAFIDDCLCLCCDHKEEFEAAKRLGWYDNLELTGKSHAVGWSHLMTDSRYKATVDIFEGGFFHTRGVFRSELASCMNNDIPYYSAISRESIVRRIKRYAGETFDFEEFARIDTESATRSTHGFYSPSAIVTPKEGGGLSVRKGSPLKKRALKPKRKK